jgi:integrase
MITPKFHLQSIKYKNGKPVDSPILLLFSVNNKRLQYYTGVKVSERFKLKGSKYPFKNEMPGSAIAKSKLDALIRHVYSIENNFIKTGAVQSIDSYKNALNEVYKGREEQDQNTFSIEDLISEYLTFLGQNRAHNTFRNTQSALNHFRAFLGEKSNKLSVATIDETIILDFQEYLKAGRLNNTVVKCMQLLKTFLQYCVKKQHIKAIPVIDSGSANDITVVHLSYDEVMNIAYCPMPNPTLERIRDFFVFGCFTGMRHSDISTLKKNNVFNDHIKIFIKKGGATQSLIIPLIEVSKKIVDKYKSTPSTFAIPSISNQKTNDYLKEVAAIVGMNSPVTIAQKDAFGKVKELEFVKSDLITCHVSRKSFITIALTLGMPEAVIKSISGHSKNSKAFSKYYHIVDDLKYQEMNRIFG